MQDSLNIFSGWREWQIPEKDRFIHGNVPLPEKISPVFPSAQLKDLLPGLLPDPFYRYQFLQGSIHNSLNRTEMR
jgi:hypothetical protein